jgi:ABC-type multidrug transport system ATPase subunit
MQSIITITDLSHSYTEKLAVNSINLSVRESEIHGLIGPDSAGKTTLMRLLCGLLPVQSGSVQVFGIDAKTGYSLIRARIGYMPQRFSLYQDLTVQENLLFFARLFGITVAEQHRILPQLYSFSRLEPFKDRKAGALSGGMKQKLALSCALIHRPELLILDEPTYGVDPVSRQEFWQMLKSIQSQGTAILVSTPYMDEAELCDTITLLYNGKSLASDPPSKIKSSWNRVVYSVASPAIRQVETQLRAISGIESCQLFGSDLHLVFTTDNESNVMGNSIFTDNSHQLQLTKIPAGMEDIFLSYMQSAS